MLSSRVVLDRKDDLLVHMKKKLQLVGLKGFCLGFFFVGNLKANDLNRL